MTEMYHRQEAFETFAKPYLPLLWRCARRMVRAAHDAEDLVQETCLKAFRAFHQFQPGTDARAWLLTILINTYRDWARKMLRQRDTLGLDDITDLYQQYHREQAQALAHTPEKAAGQAELGRLIRLVYRYLDGELAPPEALEVEHHLHTCHACQEEVAAHRRFQTLLRTTLSDEEMPERLWTAVQHRIAQEPPATGQRPSGRLRRRLWISLGTLAALLLVALTVRLWPTPSIPVVVQEIVDSQIRARLMGVPYNQLPADSEAIRQWFDDKVEFAVLVPELPQEHYTFLGVRLNYFLNRRVAEMAYASGSHVLSFFIFSDKGIALSTMSTMRVWSRTLYVQTHKGYTTVFWQDGALFCGLVSDLNLTALLEAIRHASGVT